MKGAESSSSSNQRMSHATDSNRKKHNHRSFLPPPSSFFHTNSTTWHTASLLPSLSVYLKVALGITTALYILNQNHLLPKPLSAVVSQTLFWPTLPITVSKRWGKWTTPVDETVIMGGAPFGFMGLPESLYKEQGVRGVINMCEEYRGPWKEYRKLGMKELWLPTVDHFEPSWQDLHRAVQFIKRHEKMGSKVYVHCRAGHGRSAAAVYAWLLSKDPTVDRKTLNELLCQLRNVRSTLWKQPNIIKYHSSLLSGEESIDEDDDDDDDKNYWTGDKGKEESGQDDSLSSSL